ncbi:hypothetical protein ACFL7D_03575 [candidate division KSB1 bacterium]
MVLKKYLVGLIILISTASFVNAQIHGLPVTDTADPVGKGSIHFMGNGFGNDKTTSYAGRIGYGISNRILLFTDMGIYDDEHSDNEFLAQFGARYTLPVNLPFDLAVRSSIIPYKKDFEHYIEITFGLLASRYLDQNSNLAIYGGVGIDYQEWELEFELDPAQAAYLGYSTYIDKGDQKDAAYLLGVTRQLTDSARLFLEAAHVADFFGCAGIRFDL